MGCLFFWCVGRVEEVTLLSVLSIWEDFGCCCFEDGEASRASMGSV